MKLITESFRESKSLKFILMGVFFGLVVLMTIGTFFDYQIAHAVAAEPQGFLFWSFGVSFEVLGFLPAILVNISLFAILSVYLKRKGWKIFFHVMTVFGLVGAVYCSIFWTLSNHGVDLRSVIVWPICTTIGIILSFPVIMLFKRIKDETIQKKLIYLLIIGVAMGTFANMIPGLLQVFWGRYRFFDVADYGLPYLPWYQPIGRVSGIGASTASFSSLHASSVFSMIILMMVGWKLGLKKKTQIILASISIAMLVCVPLSRMVLRWHYLTDVVFSLITSLVVLIIVTIVLDAIFGKRLKNFIGQDITEEQTTENIN
ncbi:MAG: phosphatase PAP2 family protein [Firmicutes bacterium]|nr:phosphatase PAP2 family protein [Bacillota bacterium]